MTGAYLCLHVYADNLGLLVTLCVSRRRRKMYCGHARLCVCVCVCVCLSAAVRPHYCTDTGRGRGCPLVVHYWADLQSVHRLRCYGNITRTLVYAGCARVAISDRQVTEALSTLLRRPGLRPSNGGVLAT